MIFTRMSVVDLKKLHQKIQKPIFVRFPKNNKQTFLFNNIQYCHKYKGIILYNEYRTLETTVEELLVEMTHQTYQLRQLQDDTDYRLALAVYEQYFDKPLITEEGCFAYLLALIIADYEAKHYPIASLSTVDFIDTLLEERKSSWRELQTFLGVESYFSIDYLKTVLHSDNIRVYLIIKLSYFFRLPVQAFIVGGYGD